MVGAAAAGDVGAVRVFAVPHERLVVPEAEKDTGHSNWTQNETLPIYKITAM